MAEAMSDVKLVVYKKIVDGDLRKFSATSNDTQTGGGARDLRFSPAAEFMYAFEKMFPHHEGEILNGRFSWTNHESTEAFIYPPTNSRPNEVRISRVHECFPGDVIPEDANDCILLLIWDDNGRVWPFFTSEYSLKHDNWHPTVKDAILKGLNATRSQKTTPMGYIDFTDGAPIQMENKEKILGLLDSKKNVLLMGAPGTGKSRVMNEVAEAFIAGGNRIAQPSVVPGARVPIPAVAAPNGLSLSMLQKTNRKVFRTTLHQNSQYRDFLTGIVPELGATGGYRVNEGILYRANEFAKQPDSAALLIIDELNRGPAIEVFGGSIVAIESDKRLDNNNTATTSTQFFEILSPVDGNMVEYAFSPNLYILAAMNQADTSVAPLDVAFMRRWQSHVLKPDYDVLYSYFGIDRNDPLPTNCNTASDVYSVAFHALERINNLICVSRGKDYQLGQGVFLSTVPQNATKEAALKFVSEVWGMIYAHIEELYYGDCAAIAYVVNANSPESPYQLQEVYFAGETKSVLTVADIAEDNIFALYKAIAGRDA